MSDTVDVSELAYLREYIFSRCIWSDTYSSVKHILNRTADQLPLLIGFSNANTDDDGSNENIDQTIFAFDRVVSNKLLFSPLRQIDGHENQFEIYPRHCIFATTDLYKGLFEFVRNGQRRSRIFTNLQQLIDFANENDYQVVFMSRDRIRCYYLESKSSHWTSKEYPQGAFFQGERIHQPPGVSNTGANMNGDCLECLDEEGYNVFIKMNQLGRFSLIATKQEQQRNHPELFLHSTQGPNIGSLIKQLTLQSSSNHHTNCIRLVRGQVPETFHCQYLQLVREHTYDILVGLTDENLVVEWNLESHAPCRYATNLNDILNKLSGTREEQILEYFMDQTRTNYRENFQCDMQLISTRDWAAFFQYWKWTSDIRPTNRQEIIVPYQSRTRFHLIASIQDLSYDPQTLSGEFKKKTNQQEQQQRQHRSHSLTGNHHHSERKTLTNRQLMFFSDMSKRLATPRVKRKERMSLPNPKPTNIFKTTNDTIFDESVYDSNQNSQPSTVNPKFKQSKHKTH